MNLVHSQKNEINCLSTKSSSRKFLIHYYSLLRSIPAFLATASNPFFSMVFIALVDKRSLTYRFPASHQIFLYCRFTNCNLFVLWFEWDTLFALLDFFPVKGQILPENTKTISALMNNKYIKPEYRRK